MKFIGYKTDYHTATIKILHNCTKLCTAYGVDFYYAPVKKDERLTDYYYHINGTVDLLDRLNVSVWDTPEEVKDMLLHQITEERLIACTPNTQTKLEKIKEAIKAKKWTSNGDALFCEIIGELEIAEQVRKNRAEILERQQRLKLEEAQQKEKERNEAQQAAEQKRRELINHAKEQILSELPITSEEFELIAKEYGITLPIKFIGWLREYCRSVHIKKNTPLPAGLTWKYKYDTTYRYTQKGHTSTSIYKYADMIAEKLGL